MAPDATWANITGFVPDRLEVIADEIDVLGSAVMGLTLKCARCHSHKFDPIPHRDYYRLVAVFKGALDEYDWLKPDVRPGIGPDERWTSLAGRLLPYVTTAETAGAGRRTSATAKGEAAGAEDSGACGTAASRRRRTSTAAATPQPGRSSGPACLGADRRQDAVRGEAAVAGAKKTGRRLAFARWLTQPDHPLTARVMVNRIWKHHFGTGIVATLGNFGKAGAPPTHPELLDWLAASSSRPGLERSRRMHRLMHDERHLPAELGRRRPTPQKLDPDERALLSRMPLVRLDAEALYDSLLLVAGRLDETPGGPADAGAGARGRAGDARRHREAAGGGSSTSSRRASRSPTHLETFDFPQMNPNCLERRDSTVAPQALHLMNNGMVEQLAARVRQARAPRGGRRPGEQVERGVPDRAEPAADRRGEAARRRGAGRLADEWEKQLAANATATLAERRRWRPTVTRS